MSLVIGGQKYDVPGVTTFSWLDTDAVPRTRKTNPRTARIRGIVLHSTRDRTPTRVDPGARAPSDRFAYARYAARNDRSVSWDATVLTDGTVTWQNDPLESYTWHAEQVNPYTIGIEIDQGPEYQFYEKQMAAVVLLVDRLTEILGIQRQIPWRDGAPDRRVLRRLTSEGGAGRDVVGVYAHRNVTSNRSDPADFPLLALRQAGYEGFDFESAEDLETWRPRQARAGVAADGIPLAATVAAMGGLWVTRGASVTPWLLAGIGAMGLWWAARTWA